MSLAAITRSITQVGRSRKGLVALLSAIALLFSGAAYVTSTDCDWHSKFCAFGLPGGKSEVVVGWLDGWNHLDIFKQDYPD